MGGEDSAGAGENYDAVLVTPEEIEDHMHDLLTDGLARWRRQQNGEQVLESGPVHLVADFLEGEACKVLAAAGYRPLMDLTGYKKEAVRLEWMNEVFQLEDAYYSEKNERGSSVSRDCLSPGVRAAVNVMLYGSNLRDMLEISDCERAALNMMGMIGAAMAGGFYYEAMRRARAETEAEKARRQAEQAESKAVEGLTPSAAASVLRKEAAAPNEAARAWVEKFAEPLLKDVKTANEILEAIKCEPREKVPKLPSKETLMSWINGLRGELGLPKPRGGRPRKQGGST